jgi:hypothetical protein
MWTEHAALNRITVVSHPDVDSTSFIDETRITVKPQVPADDNWDAPHVDLNGNEIDDAVGDYRIDERGELYERHAPDTALPHLGEPSL